MPPPYLWIYLVFICVAIIGLIVLGLSAALRAAGYSPTYVRSAGWIAGGLLSGWLVAAGGLGWAGLFVGSRDARFPFIALAVGAPIVLGAWGLRRSATVA